MQRGVLLERTNINMPLSPVPGAGNTAKFETVPNYPFDRKFDYFTRRREPQPTQVVNDKPRPSSSLRRRRDERYALAENALSSTLREADIRTSSRQLQIAALERATTILDCYAREAQQRADQLRKKLEDKSLDLDPVIYDALKRQRWIEERRQERATREELALREHLEVLVSEHDRPTTPPAATEPSSAKQQANLATFLQQSPTKRPLTLRGAVSHTDLQSSTKKWNADNTILRRRVCSGNSTCVSPSVRSWPPSYLNPQRLADIPSAESPPTTHEFPRRIALSALAARNPFKPRPEHEATPVPPLERPTRSRAKSIASALAAAYATRRTMPRPPLVPQNPLPPTPEMEHENSEGGYAILEAPPRPRSNSDVLKDLDPIPLPTYALNLMDEFERQTPPLNLAPQGVEVPSTRGRESSLSSMQPSTPSSSKPVKAAQAASPPSRRLRESRSLFSFQFRSRKTSPPPPPPKRPNYHNDQPSSRRLPPSGLPSTRQHDLALLGPAPDDIPVSPQSHNGTVREGPSNFIRRARQRFSSLIERKNVS